jgi:predicted amidohydrolase
VNPTTGRRFVPADVHYTPDDGDFEYATSLKLLGETVDACGKDAGRVVLLLSTCRNQWLTVNAVFVDLKLALAPAGARPDHADAAIRALRLDPAPSESTGLDRSLRASERASSEALKLSAQVREKLRVWEDRQRLVTLLEAEIESLAGIDRSRMRRWLERQRSGERDGVPPWQRRYVAFNIQETDACTSWLKTLERCERTLTASMQVVRHAARMLDPAAPDVDSQLVALTQPVALFEVNAYAEAEAEAETAAAEPDLSEVDSIGSHAETWQHLLERLRADASALGMSVVDGEDTLTLQLPNAERLDLPIAQPDEPGLRPRLDALVGYAANAIEGARELLGAQFAPNLAALPLPAPFEIDLTTPERGSAERARSFTINPSLASGEPTPDSATIALLDCPMPEDEYTHAQPELYVYDPHKPGARIAKDLAFVALSHAREAGAQLVVMPEVFLPRGAVDELVETAQSMEIGLIAGIEYPQTPVGGAINEAIISLPTLSRPLRQRKQAPSVFEMRQANFDADGIIQIVRRTPFGTIGTIICSDFMELDHLWAMANRPHAIDLLVICARNRRPEVFHRLAIADAIRLHAYVAVANAHPEWTQEKAERERVPGLLSGSIIAQPSGSKPFVETRCVALPPSAAGGPQARLLIGDLHIADVRARDRERAGARGFLPPPRFPRWQPLDPS